MKKILVPIDFSAISGYALEFALQISEDKRTELIFFHLNESPVFKDVISEKGVRIGIKPDHKRMEQLIQFVKKRLDDKKKKKGTRRFKFIVEAGSKASEAIVAVAKKHKADLILMGTKGASGIKKVVFGSVASNVIRESSVPVIVVPSSPGNLKKMDLIYSTDLLHSQHELQRLKDLQDLLGGALEVLYINYGWAFTKKEQKEYDYLKNSGIKFNEKKVSLKKPLAFHLQKFMMDKPDAVLALFHEKKGFLEKLLFGNRLERFAMEIKGPMVSLQKK